MATSRGEAAFSVIARDKASAIFDRISRSSGRLGLAWERLVRLIKRVNIGFIAMTTLLPILGAAFASFIAVTTSISFVKFEQGMRRTRVQLSLLGLSAIQARGQVATLASMMDRAAATSFFNSAAAINTVAIAGFELTKALIPMATAFAEVIGADPAQVFIALFDIVAKHDPDKFAQLVLGVTGIAIPLEILASIRAGDVQPVLDFIQEMIADNTITGLEKVAKNLQRIADLTRPTRERITEDVALLVNVFIESLAEQMERAADRLGLAIQGAFATAVIISGTGLGGRLGAGLIAGLAILLLFNLGGVISDIIESPEVVAGILLTAFAVGKQIGGVKGGIIGGIIFILGTELLPGLTTLFKDLSTENQLKLSGLVIGVALGTAIGLGIFQSIFLGLVLRNVVNGLFSGDSIEDKVLRVTIILLGAAIGFLLGNAIGAVVGASLAAAFADLILDSTIQEAFQAIGKSLGDLIMTGILNVLINLPIAIVNLVIEAINDVTALLDKLKIPGLKAPQIPTLDPVDVKPIVDFTGTGGPLGDLIKLPDLITKKAFTPSIITGLQGPFPFDPDEFEHGGVVPGPIGAPRMAIVHGGETILPGGTMIIQLILDKRVISEVSVDAVNRVARFNAGMVPGSIGS